MGVQPLSSMTTRRALATGLALAVLFWQVLLSGGAAGQLMAPIQVGEAGLIICTEHGMQTLPLGGAPSHDPADHSAPPCPCCLSFAAADAAILPPATMLAAPAWVAAPQTIITAATIPSPLSAPDPLQPRAPPVSV